MVNCVSTIDIGNKLYVIIASTWEPRTNFSCHTRFILRSVASKEAARTEFIREILRRLNRVRWIQTDIGSVAKVGVCELLLERNLILHVHCFLHVIVVTACETSLCKCHLVWPRQFGVGWIFCLKLIDDIVEFFAIAVAVESTTTKLIRLTFLSIIFVPRRLCRLVWSRR